MPHGPGIALQADIHVIAAGGASDGLISHTGEEVGYVLEGVVELIVEDRTMAARSGGQLPFPVRTAARIPQRRGWDGAHSVGQHAADVLTTEVRRCRPDARSPTAPLPQREERKNRTISAEASGPAGSV